MAHQHLASTENSSPTALDMILASVAYYSDFWSGSVSVIPYDNDGDGLNSLNDCNDTDAELGSTATDLHWRRD